MQYIILLSMRGSSSQSPGRMYSSLHPLISDGVSAWSGSTKAD